MRQPEGYVKKGQEGKVCKLNKALYGLKQGSKAWNSKLNKKLKEIGLTRSLVDQCIYYYIRANKYYILAVFVDDIIVFTKWEKVSSYVKKMLFSSFSMKDWGDAKRCFGINVIRDRRKGTIQLHQSEYIDSILASFNHSDCKPASTPMEKGTVLKPADPKSKWYNSPGIPCQNAVGATMFLF